VGQRLVKIGLSIAVGLLAGLWCLNNLLNWETAADAVGYALSQQNQSGYDVQLIPATESATLATIGLMVICAAEAGVAALSLVGAGKMWRQRRADDLAFGSAKQPAIIGAGVAVLTWFLGFQVVGGAGIMMGQAEGMEAAMRGAFTFGSYSFLTLIFLSLPEPKTV
jgi:predicted small integral membrane protein